MRYVVYTSVFGSYDWVFPPLEIEDDICYVLFTDNPGLSVRGWKTVVVEADRFHDARAANRYYKMLAHKEFPDFDYSLYIDGNIRLLGKTSRIIREFHSSESCLGLFRHPIRSSVREEADSCVMTGKITNTAALEKELSLYREYGFLDDVGLVEATVNFKNHQHPSLAEAMELWWSLFERFGTRDQISLPYVLWKKGVPCTYQPFSFRDPNPYFGFYTHRGDQRAPRYYAYVEGRSYDSHVYALILGAWHLYWEVRRAIRRGLKMWGKR
jgi:hypothetical protein